MLLEDVVDCSYEHHSTMLQPASFRYMKSSLSIAITKDPLPSLPEAHQPSERMSVRAYHPWSTIIEAFNTYTQRPACYELKGLNANTDTTRHNRPSIHLPLSL